MDGPMSKCLNAYCLVQLSSLRLLSYPNPAMSLCASVASSVAVQNTTAVIQYNTVYYGTVIGTVLDSENLYARLIRPYILYYGW